MFDRLKKIGHAMTRTREAVFGQVADLFDQREVDDTLWDELEELLIRADVGVPTTEYILERTKERVQRHRIKDGLRTREAFKSVLVEVLNDSDQPTDLEVPFGKLTTVLVVGVNGVGKTTSIAKLAGYWQQQGHRCVIAAGDTFRAAAIDQLKIWGDRVGAPVVSHQPGADPGAVVFDAWQAAVSRNADVLIIDTAGRLHTKNNLMDELRKLYKILAKQQPGAPEATLLVLDATIGQNSLVQAREFQKSAAINGLVLTKIDGTAKGGSVFPIVRELRVPVLFLASGEHLEDLEPFDARTFVDALVSNGAEAGPVG